MERLQKLSSQLNAELVVAEFDKEVPKVKISKIRFLDIGKNYF